MSVRPDPPTILSLINTSGIVGVLVVALWLGIRGDVVTAGQLHDCQIARDAYLQEWIKAITPAPPQTLGPIPPWRDTIGRTVTSEGPLP